MNCIINSNDSFISELFSSLDSLSSFIIYFILWVIPFDLSNHHFFLAVFFEGGEVVGEKSSHCTPLIMMTIMDGP